MDQDTSTPQYLRFSHQKLQLVPKDHPKKCGNSSCLRRTPCAPQTMEHYVVVPFLRRLAAFTTSAPRRVSLGGWRNWWLSENQESSSFLKCWYPQIIIFFGGLEHFLFFHTVGIIIPTDEVTFFRGVGGPHQPGIESQTWAIGDIFH